MKIIILFLLLISCGKETYYIEPEILPFVEEFNRDSPVEAVGVEIIFSELDGQNGICYMESKRIYIDKERWNAFSYTKRKVLIYHELGHCVLGLGHDSEMKNTCPKTIMHPYCVLYTRCYRNEEKWENYLDQLFGR